MASYHCRRCSKSLAAAQSVRAAAQDSHPDIPAKEMDNFRNDILNLALKEGDVLCMECVLLNAPEEIR